MALFHRMSGHSGVESGRKAAFGRARRELLFPVVLAGVDRTIIVLVPAALAVRVVGDDPTVVDFPNRGCGEGEVGRAADDGDVVARGRLRLTDGWIEGAVVREAERASTP